MWSVIRLNLKFKKLNSFPILFKKTSLSFCFLYVSIFHRYDHCHVHGYQRYHYIYTNHFLLSIFKRILNFLLEFGTAHQYTLDISIRFENHQHLFIERYSPLTPIHAHLYLMHPRRPPSNPQLQVTDLMICAPWAGVTFGCLANGMDHSPCCRSRGLPESCLPLCSGNVTNLDFNHFK